MVSCNSNATKDNSDEKVIADTSALVKFEVVTNAIKFPVQMSAVPDDTHRLFISDLGGEIMVLKNGNLLSQPFLNLRSKLETKDSTPEVRGMFGFTFHPQFSQQ